MSCTSQRRGAGGIVSMLILTVIGQLRRAGKGLGIEAGRGGVEFVVASRTKLAESESLGIVIRPVATSEDRRQPLDDGSLSLGPLQFAEDLVGVRVRFGTGQFLGFPEGSECLIERASLSKGKAEVFVSLPKIGAELQSCSAFNNCLVELSQGGQVRREVDADSGGSGGSGL